MGGSMMDSKPFMVEVTLFNLDEQKFEQVGLGFENVAHLIHTITGMMEHLEFYKRYLEEKRLKEMN